MPSLALEQDGFHAATADGAWVLVQGNGQLSARSVEALLQARRVQSCTIEHAGTRSLPLDRLAEMFDVQYSDGQLCLSRQQRLRP
jgi:hypothetical protein